MRIKQKSTRKALVALLNKHNFYYHLGNVQSATSFEELGTVSIIVQEFIDTRKCPPYTGTELVMMKREAEQAIVQRNQELIVEAAAVSSAEDEQEDFVPEPPRALEGFMCLLTPRTKRNELLGQFAELYTEWTEKYGERWAKALYATEIARSLGPVLGRNAGWFVKYKVLHYLGEIIGRFSQH